MKLSSKRLCYFTLIGLIIYMFYKVPIDNITFGVFKGIMAGIVMLTFGLCFFRYPKNICFQIVAFVFIVYFLYIVIFAFWDGDNRYVSRGLYEYLLYQMMFFSGVYLIRKIDSVEKVYKVIGAVCIPMLLVAIFQFYRGAFSSGIRVLGFARSEMAQGVLSGIALLIGLYAWLISKKRLYVVTMIVASVALVLSGSRGPLVACFIALVVIYAIYKYEKEGVKSFFKIIFVGIIATVAIMWFFNHSFNTGISQLDDIIVRIQAIIDWQGDAGNVGRINRWARWIAVFEQNKIWGIGLSRTGSWGAAAMGATESGLVRHLVEMGIVGSILYYLIIIVPFGMSMIRFCKIKNKDKKDITFVLLNVGIIVLILVEDLVLQITEEITVSFFLWITQGMLFGYIEKMSRKLKTGVQ